LFSSLSDRSPELHEESRFIMHVKTGHSFRPTLGQDCNVR
jgi:hypothetical protein